MRTLAIDTSHAAGTVAATSEGRSAIRPLGSTGEHAQLLAARLTEVAEVLGWPIAEADLIAVVRGPGSFTGLRVGVATAKAIAWAAGARLVGLSGFELVARETARLTGWSEGPLAIAFDAGRGEVYAATATADRDLPAGWRIEPAVLRPVAAWIAGLPSGGRVSGPAVERHGALLAAAGLPLAPPEAWFPTASAAAELGLLRAATGETHDPHTLVPEYLRQSYAEEARPAPGPGALPAS